MSVIWPILIIYTFHRFCHDLRGHVKEQHPEYTLGEIAKELGRRWGVSDDATKAQYAAKAEQDRARYERVSIAFTVNITMDNLFILVLFNRI